MADLTCGQGGSTGLEIVTRINENTAAATANADAIALLQADVIELEHGDPRASVRLATSVPAFTITDDLEPVLMPCFDTIVTEQAGFDAYIDPVDSGGNLTNSTGFSIKCLVAMGLNVDFPANETLEVYVYINGARYSDNPMVMQGEGSGHPVSVYWESEVELADGDTLDIRGRNGDTGSYDIAFLRSTFRMDADWSERVIP